MRREGVNMNAYRNVMETIVVQKLNDLWDSLDCCKCEKCYNDIIALTLNQLEPKYVVSNEGELYVRLGELSNNQDCEILTTIAKAIKIVSENPKHDVI